MAKNIENLGLNLNDLRTEKVPDHKDKKPKKKNGYEPPNLGKAIRLPVPDFNDPTRKATCLEVDFPIAPINALARLEATSGAAKKPIYQMSKWWARRQSSVFRSLLIAAAAEVPEDLTQAAKKVWDHYYCNHHRAGSFKKLKVLDIFMGGGTTLVEGARLGMQMTGVDLNPVAWFVTKNELACSDPEQVKAFFEHIEAEVKPLIQPFYTTTCPRGHEGKWINVESGKTANVDPAELSPNERKKYRWDGPEIIYTFWAKHGPCQAKGCGHRTPIFRTPVIAEKKLTSYYLPSTCLACGHSFNIELGETRMAPGAERVVLGNEPSFIETTQTFAQLLKDYSKGKSEEKKQRVRELNSKIESEPGLKCPKCGVFAGHAIENVVKKHIRAQRVSDLKKKDYGIESRHTFMYLLIHPEWLKGSSGLIDKEDLGGYAGADPEQTAIWFENRLAGMQLIEVRGRIKLTDEEIDDKEKEESQSDEGSANDPGDESALDRKGYGLPSQIVLADGTILQTKAGTVPQQSHFTCQKCGKKQDILESVRATKRTAPVAAYALQCHCPQCDAEGYSYNGRYFKSVESSDVNRLILADHEWILRNETDLNDYWPRSELQPAYMTHKLNGGIPNWGFTHWWKMFNPRQLLVHTQLLRAMAEAPDDRWSLDVKEQALGAFQQYLRSMSMFSFYHVRNDQLAAALSNPNFHPKQLVLETCVFHRVGSGRWGAYTSNVINALRWIREPSEAINIGKAASVVVNDAIVADASNIICGSSTDLAILDNTEFDLIITDPPFGNNLFYADLSDFFYVWMRLPLLKWYHGMPERKYFEPERTPHAVEAIDNSVERPDNRYAHESERFVTNRILSKVKELTGDTEIIEKDPNPLYQPVPASEFYQRTLTDCWAEAGRLLKPAGLMAFTFHHSEDAPWVDVLEALFNAGYLLVATYPIRSDETKGAKGAFGSRKIEYDIIHVCRKRLEDPQPVSWARMRRWVKEEAGRLKELLEHSHGKELPESDLLVILRGKALEFYSRHYGQVYTGDGQLLGVRDALLGINQLLEDLLQGNGDSGKRRPPDSAEPASRLFLRIFGDRPSIARDELHKTLRGTGIAQADLEARGWIKAVGTTIHVVSVADRFQFFTERGRTRKILKTDLDQVHFLVGAAMPGSGLNVQDELSKESFVVKRSVETILEWYAEVDSDKRIRETARLAAGLVKHWRTQIRRKPEEAQMTLFERLEAEGE